MAPKTALHLALALLAAAGTCSCGHGDREPLPPQPKTRLTLTISRAFNPTGVNPDSIWGEPYEPDAGNAFDNTVHNVTVRYTLAARTYTVPMTTLRPTAQGGMLCEAEIDGRLPAAQGVRVQVWANAEPDRPTFTQSSLPQDGIPMWGVTTVDFQANRDIQSIGAVDLLRAAAKIDIVLSGDVVVGNNEITSATLETTLPLGYVLPASTANVGVTGELSFDASKPNTCFHPNSTPDNPAISSIPFRVLDPDGSIVRLYVPEIESPNPIKVILKARTKGTNLVYTYQDVYDAKGNLLRQGISFPAKIVRNTYYRCEIKSMDPLANKLTAFHYHVCPWHDKTADIPEFD